MNSFRDISPPNLPQKRTETIASKPESKGYLGCKSCGKPVAYLKHKETNKPAPIEAEPSPNGNIFIAGEFYRMATNDEIEKAKRIGKPLYLNHFATCEFAKSFSKKEPAKPKVPLCVYCELELNYFEKDGSWFCSMGCSQKTEEK